MLDIKFQMKSRAQPFKTLRATQQRGGRPGAWTPENNCWTLQGSTHFWLYEGLQESRLPPAPGPQERVEGQTSGPPRFNLVCH